MRFIAKTNVFLAGIGLTLLGGLYQRLYSGGYLDIFDGLNGIYGGFPFPYLHYEIRSVYDLSTRDFPRVSFDRPIGYDPVSLISNLIFWIIVFWAFKKFYHKTKQFKAKRI